MRMENSNIADLLIIIRIGVFTKLVGRLNLCFADLLVTRKFYFTPQYSN